MYFTYRVEALIQLNILLRQMIYQCQLTLVVIRTSTRMWSKRNQGCSQTNRRKRLVIDFRNLNKVTIDDKNPIPNINEVLRKLSRSHYFTMLDLAKISITSRLIKMESTIPHFTWKVRITNFFVGRWAKNSPRDLPTPNE